MRACIGRPFAWQEAALVLASVFSRFDVYFADPGYTLEIKQALTIKPKGLRVRVAPRRRGGAGVAVGGRVSKPLKVLGEEKVAGTARTDDVTLETPKKPLYVLYGSNTGTSEAFAGRIASEAVLHGQYLQIN